MPPRDATGAIVQLDAPKAQKGSLVDIFSKLPEDHTTEQSKWEAYSQISTQTDPITIVVNRTRDWIDPQKFLLEYQVEYLRDNGTDRLRPGDKAFPVNNTGHSLIKQMKVYINKSSVQNNDEYYHYQAYFDRLLNYSKADKDGWLSFEGWATDTPGKFNNVDPTQAAIPAIQAEGGAVQANSYTPNHLRDWIRAAFERAVPNEGATKRHKLITQQDGNGEQMATTYFIRPYVPLFDSYRYLPPGLEIKFEIYWNNSRFAMMAAQAGNAGADTPKFRVVNYSPRLWVRHVVAESDLHIALEGAMLNKQQVALYPHLASRVITDTIPDGMRERRLTDIWNGKRPSYMVVGFLPQAAFIGSYTDNGYNFRDMHQTSVKVLVNGQETPYQRIDLRSFHKDQGYNTWVQFSGQSYDSPDVGISRTDYKDGNYLLLFNFTPDGNQNFNYNYNRLLGNINLEVEFGQAIANNTTIIIVGYFEQTGLVEGNINFGLEHSV